LLSVEVFNLRKCFAALCLVLAGLICALYQVVTLFPELKEFFPDGHNHSSGPRLSGERDCCNPMSSEMFVLKLLPFVGYLAVE
jgi:hypothetical protein